MEPEEPRSVSSLVPVPRATEEFGRVYVGVECEEPLEPRGRGPRPRDLDVTAIPEGVEHRRPLCHAGVPCDEPCRLEALVGEDAWKGRGSTVFLDVVLTVVEFRIVMTG